MKDGLGRKAALYIVALLGSWLVRLWFATCRIHVHGIENRKAAESSGKPIVGTSWHYAIMGIFAFYRELPLVLMISSSSDGDFLTRMAERLDFTVVRGSSNRKGATAAKELIRELRKGKSGGLVADGSQGPARVAQSGSLLLAGKAGGLVLPMVWSASRYFAFNTWDRLIIPKPFSRIDLIYGEPVLVPEGIKVNQLKEYRTLLEKNLSDIYDKAWGLYGKKEH